MTVQQYPHATATAELTIWTVRFGAREQVAVDAASLFTFVEPIPGLPGSRRFALIADAAFAPLHWLQSLDEWEICLPVLALESVELPGYADDVATAIGTSALTGSGPHGASGTGMDGLTAVGGPGGSAGARSRVLLVTHLGADALAVNLLAPIVLDLQSATGSQVILDGPPKGTPDSLRSTANGSARDAANDVAADAPGGPRRTYALRQALAWQPEARVFRPC